jgi:glycerol-3-phosphate dehydrogenase
LVIINSTHSEVKTLVSFDDFDVVIIGGGVIGCAIARELSHYKLKTVLLERSVDLAAGASRANTGLVHAGFDPTPGTLKAKLNVEGSRQFDTLTAELKVPFVRNGAMVIAFDEVDIPKLEELKKRGEDNSAADLSILDDAELKRIAPAVSGNANAALFAETAGIVSPYELVFALAENAAVNGVEIRLNSKVESIETHNGATDDRFVIKTSKAEYATKVVINAAGLFADEIANMVGEAGFAITPRRGEYYLFDKNTGIGLTHTLFPLPTELGKGIVVTPTTGGNLLLGPNAENIEDKTDCSTTSEALSNVLNSAQQLVPSLSKRHVITSFAGLRAASNTGDFVIGPGKVPNFINAAGIQSPGLTAAPAIAKLVVSNLPEALGQKELVKNAGFNPVRKHAPVFHKLPGAKRQALIDTDAAYGNIVCRCEHITEAEVHAATSAKPGATTLDGIKLRTRAGMGRCQGGFCSDRIMNLLSSDLNIPIESITKHEPGSYILTGKTKVRGRIP